MLRITELAARSLLLLVFVACSGAASRPGLKPPEPGLHTIEIAGVPCDIVVPQNPRGTLLVLPGWNFPRESWRKNSRLEKLAAENGLILVLPEMLKTLYETSYYPETRMKWNPVPGGEFIKTKLIPELQTRYSLFKPGQFNFLLGLSTGGRGVAMLALENPGLFTAGAAFSGDFAQEKMSGEAITIAVYGTYAQFPDRWKGRDNPKARVAEWKMPLYLSHGLSDTVVPPDQTQSFGDALRDVAPGLVEMHLKAGYGHDYKFWDAELTPAIAFFARHIK
ncbi:MAG: prolyl oligopeptidase family serine peptidase [Leptospirales bacterium]|nr:prolyl oligopeptidase family serine peptidase [Leptospirales bacterium]